MPKKKALRTFLRPRLLILANLAFLPVRLIVIAVGMVYMIVTVPLLFVAIVVTLLPAEIGWICSPFVGLVSPAAGSVLADYMETASDALAAVIDFIWWPLGWVFDVALADLDDW